MKLKHDASGHLVRYRFKIRGTRKTMEEKQTSRVKTSRDRDGLSRHPYVSYPAYITHLAHITSSQSHHPSLPQSFIPDFIFSSTDGWLSNDVTGLELVSCFVLVDILCFVHVR